MSSGSLTLLAVVGRQARDGALEIAHRRQVLIEPLLVGRAERRLQRLHVVADEIEHALLAVDPALVPDAEQAIEQVLRNVLLRQRALVARPRHVAVDVLAVRFLRDADLQRAEARLRADLRGENLIDRRPRRAAARVGRAGHQAAQRAEVAVALAVEARRDVVDAAEHVHVIAHAAERREARRQLVVFARLARNPVALGNTVAVIWMR